MSRWIYGALRDMDDGARSRPSSDADAAGDHPLELFVTTTDFTGYDRDLVIGDPPLIHDRAHRHVFAFRHGDGDDHFSKRRQRSARLLGARDLMRSPAPSRR